jgi:ribonuclease BN (tRNA processing enzyme)
MSRGGSQPFVAVTILGSGTCVPSLERSSCAVMLETGSSLLLFDAGAGTIRRVLESGKQLSDITHILLSHFHPDHCAELVSILFASKYPAATDRNVPLTVSAGEGLLEFLAGLKKAFGDWIELPKEMVRFEEMSTEKLDFRQFADFQLESIPVQHNPESIAYRICTGSCRVVYSGDTQRSENLVALADKADLLICESAMPDGQGIAGHLTPSQAGEIAQRAGVRHLVLTHFYPACTDADIAGQCRSRYSGKLTLAEDLLRFEISNSADGQERGWVMIGPARER